MNLEDFIQAVIDFTKVGYSIKESIEKVKGYCSPETINNLVKEINSIIAPGEDIDNNEIYDTKTGITKRDLI